jgi:hypothetical protein
MGMAKFGFSKLPLKDSGQKIGIWSQVWKFQTHKQKRCGKPLSQNRKKSRPARLQNTFYDNNPVWMQ